MSKKMIDRMKEIKESYKSGVEKAQTDLKEEYKSKAKYLNENRLLGELDETSPMRKQFDRKLEDYDNRIAFHKNTVRYSIEDVITYAQKENKEIEKYIDMTDTKAKLEITSLNNEKTPMEEEKRNLEEREKVLKKIIEKKTEMFPEDTELYIKEENKELKEIESKLSTLDKKMKEIDEEILMYSSRESLLKDYNGNLKLIKDMKKFAKDNNIDLTDKSFGDDSEEPLTTPETMPGTISPTTPEKTPETMPGTISPTTHETTPGTIPPITPETTPETIPPTTPETIPASTPLTESRNEDKIVIGRKGYLIHDGKKYKISKGTIREGSLMNIYDIQDKLEEIGVDYVENSFLRATFRKDLLDPVIINAICSSKMDNKDKINLVQEYLANLDDAISKKTYNNKLNITYDLNDLGKASLISRFLGREVKQREKFSILKRAATANRYGIAKEEGEYRPNRRAKLLEGKNGKILTLQDEIDRAHIIAEEYNNARYDNDGNKRTREDFVQQLNVKIDLKNKDLDVGQKRELIDLVKSQDKQDSPER